MTTKPTFKGYTFEEIKEESNSSVMLIRNETGEGTMRSSESFDGISLTYNQLEMKNCYQQSQTMKGYISLNFCRKGCFEVTLKSDDKYFIREGDLVINDLSRSIVTNSGCPTGYYEGFTIVIEFEKARKWIETNSAWADCSWLFSEAFLNGRESVRVIPHNQDIWHLADGFYSKITLENKSMRIAKILELFNLLSGMTNEATEIEHYSSAVSEATQKIYRYLSEHLHEKITTDLLCRKFGVSKTSLNKCFKSIYGQTPAGCLKSMRMNYAAQLILSEKGKSISEIASVFGYDNASKFSAAFRSVMGICPLEYRRQKACISCKNAKME